MVQAGVLASLGAKRVLGDLTAGAGPGPIPWHQRHPPDRPAQFQRARSRVELDVEEWADYWASLKVDAVLVSVTGILAFYPTDVPFHRRSQFLGDRDLFGACAAAAKKRGLRVIARMSPDLNWDDATQGRTRNGSCGTRRADSCAHGEDPRLFRTCTFSTYFTEHMPAIMREVQARYDVDGLFTNAWPPLDGLPVCYCDEVPEAGQAQVGRLLAPVHRPRRFPVEALRRDREGEEAGQPLLCEHGRAASGRRRT